MNIYDISKKSGVSIATVSRAINNSGYVSEKTRAKIMKVIEENNYTPNAFAKSIGGNSIKCIGILCTDPRDVYQATCLYHLEKNLRKEGYSSLLSCTGHELAEKKQAVSQLLARSVDALIFIGSQFTENNESDNQYILDASRHLPVIMLNGHVAGSNVFCLTHDDYHAMKDLTNLVLENGARHPVFLTRRENYSGQRKLKGFVESCRMHGLDQPDHYFVKDDLEEILNCIEDLHLSGKGVDAYLCADDEIALAALKYVQSHDQHVPDDVQICGYNNSVLSQASTPEISTYDNQLSFLCQSAVRTMLGVLSNHEYPNKFAYEGKMIPKGTTRTLVTPPPSNSDANAY